ncbi:mRNA export factor Gle2p [Diutina catenulata]
MSRFNLNTATPAAPTGAELQNDVALANGPEDSIQCLSFSSQSNHLLVGSWDKKVRIYEIDPASGQNQGRAMFEHDGPVLSAAWSTDGTQIVSGSADKQVKLFNLQTQQAQQIGVHNDAVRSVRYVECGPSNTPVVVSGSWDKTLKYWDMRTPNPVATVQLPERVYAMDSISKLLVVGCAERHNVIINLENPQNIFKTKESPLKWQTRVITCYPQADGFAIGSIEGRCAIQYIDDAVHSERGFSFKCHRQSKSGTLRTPLKVSDSTAYPVNAISFHPGYGTFSTAGSDGTFAFWDKDARQKLKAFPNVGGAITSTAFNRDGSIFAYGVSYDWSQGFQANKPDYPTVVKLHPTKPEEIQQKKKTR